MNELPINVPDKRLSSYKTRALVPFSQLVSLQKAVNEVGVAIPESQLLDSLVKKAQDWVQAASSLLFVNFFPHSLGKKAQQVAVFFLLKS